MENSKSNISVINTFDLIKSCHKNQQRASPECDTIFESHLNKDLVFLKNDKCYCLNQRDEGLNVHLAESSTSLHVVSLAFNRKCIFYVKNNGECYISNGVDSGAKGYTSISQLKLGDINMLTLKNSTKLLGGLDKKYIVKVVCGEEHVLFLTHSGMVFALGENSSGQLGIGSNQSINGASMLSTLLDYRITDIFAGANHCIAYGIIRDLNKKDMNKEEGENYLFAWGDNSFCQLGLDQSYSIPTKVNTFSNIVNKEKEALPSISAITGGMNHSLVLFDDGSFYAFGDNQHKQSNPNSKEAIIKVPTLVEVDFISKKKGQIHDIKSGANSVAIITNQMYVVIYGKIYNKERKILKLTANAEKAILTLTDEKVSLFYWGNRGPKDLYTEEKDTESSIQKKSSSNLTVNQPVIAIPSLIDNEGKSEGSKASLASKKPSEGFVMKIPLNTRNIKEKDRYQSSSDISREEKLIKTEESQGKDSAIEEGGHTSSSSQNLSKRKEKGVDNDIADFKPPRQLQSDETLKPAKKVQSKQSLNEKQNEPMINTSSLSSKQLIQPQISTPTSTIKHTQSNEQQKIIFEQELKQQKPQIKPQQDKKQEKPQEELQPQPKPVVKPPEKKEEPVQQLPTKLLSQQSRQDKPQIIQKRQEKQEPTTVPSNNQSNQSKINAQPIVNTTVIPSKGQTLSSKETSTQPSIIQPIQITNKSIVKGKEIELTPNSEESPLEISVEQSMLELSSYMHAVGPLDSIDLSTSEALSFRPKNLPKKTQEEEEYHRRLVEDNKKKYLSTLKDKQEKELKAKKRAEDRKKKQHELEVIWKKEIIPDWFKRKKERRTRQLFYEGVPGSIRGRVWLLSLGNTFSITRDYYEIELKNAIDIYIESSQSSHSFHKDGQADKRLKDYNIVTISKESSIHVIDLDIERTFPYLGIFKANSPLSEDLREILRAFVASRPDIGYVQGLSFIAGMLLLNMDKFQSYVALMNLILNPNIIPFYRFEECGIRTRLQLFKQIFYLNLPELCDHFESLDILPEHYFIEWNMTLFCKNISIDIATRIWDIYMIEGMKAIYQAAIVFLSHYEQSFLQMGFEDILQTLKALHTVNFDEDQIISSMQRVNFPDWILLEITKLNNDNIPLN